MALPFLGADSSCFQGRHSASAYYTIAACTQKRKSRINGLLGGHGPRRQPVNGYEKIKPELHVIESEPKVYIIDDDPAMRQLLGAVVASMQLCPQPCASADEFLELCTPSEPGCVLLDVRMPGMRSLELLDLMRRQGIAFPVIVLSAQANVPRAVRAMRAGAINFFEKPIREQELVEAIREGVHRDVQHRRVLTRKRCLQRRIAKLKPGERTVLNCLLRGKANKDIAAELGLSLRTIEVRRAKVMDTMQADSLAQLVRFALYASLPDREAQALEPEGP